VLSAIRLLLPALEEYFVLADCPIPGGCSRFRHDMLFLSPTFAFAIELDEHGNKHEDYRGRLRALQKDHGRQASLVLRSSPNNPLRPMLKRAGGTGFEGYSTTPQFDGCMTTGCDYISKNVLAHVDAFPPRCRTGNFSLTVDKLFF
jgi:hypothetical protein